MPASLTLVIVSPDQDDSEELAAFIERLIKPYLGESTITNLDSGRWVYEDEED